MKQKFELFDCFDDAVCVFDRLKNPVYKNNAFCSLFGDITSFDKFKKRFDFDLCLLSSENISQKTPLDLMFSSLEKFYTACSYRTGAGNYINIYIYMFLLDKYKVVVFKNMSEQSELIELRNKYKTLLEKDNLLVEKLELSEKQKENASSRVLKMGIVNRISLVIRETNDLSKIISRACEEINSLSGGFKTYFLLRDKSKFKIVYSSNEELSSEPVFPEYDQDTLKLIKEKQIAVSNCRKEYVNSSKVFQAAFKRVIIPVYNRNKLLGIIVTLTRQKFAVEENTEVLQAVSAQLSGALITSGLISQLNKKNKKLEKALSELKDTQIQLINTEKMASLGRLVSGVAHEINTPLASINSNTGLMSKLLNGLTEYNEDKIKLLKDLNNIESKAVKRISDIVKSLRKFVRLDEAEFQPANINDELDLTLQLLKHETQNNIDVIKNYGNIPPVMCSVNMLNQVFMNLLVNSCRSIKEKNIHGEIVISTSVNNGMLFVSVKDNGNGIPQNIASKIFNAGFTTREKGIGTGLGLAISKKIVELHKGTITFRSTEGKDCEFTVKIPLKA